MASGLITLWQIDGIKVEKVANFIFLVSKITADCDCSHEIKRHLLLGRKSVTNLDSVFKSRVITLPHWLFIRRTDTEVEAPILWPPDAKSLLIGKDPGAGKDWGQEERVQQRLRWLDGHEFEQTAEDSEGQGSLMCCSPWGCKELVMS